MSSMLLEETLSSRIHEVGVLLNRYEGFWIAIVEAMASDVSVVATDVPGARVVSQGSLADAMVPYGDLEETLRTVTALLNIPASRQRMEETGENAPCARFSEGFWKQKVDRFYQSVIG